MPLIPIEDADDPRVRDYLHLTDHQLRSRAHPEDARMICESQLVIEAALDAGLTPLSLLLDERHLAHSDRMSPLLARLPEGTPVYIAPTALMSQVAGFTITRGFLSCFRRPEPMSPERVITGAQRIVVLESIVDTTNVGAIFRSAAALGADGLLLAPTCADPLSRRALRTSMGTVFKVPWARLPTPWPASAFTPLKAAGFTTAALALAPDALTLDDPTLAATDRLALFFGTEGDGLTRATLASCDHVVTIPMHHGVDSLNVASAAALTLWQLRTK